jgi:hypothetical protein
VSHASKLLLLSCLACAFACTVPTIDELEATRPTGCNSDHKCPSDSVCFENRCIRTADLGCIPGERLACGTAEGTCSQGSRLCGAEGTYGACEGEVGPSFEMCDGEDNDCDGTPDNWDPLQLSGSHQPGSSVAAIAVDRSSVGKPNTLLVVTVEAGSLLIRTRTADGVLSPAVKLSPTGPDSTFHSPTLVADKDAVALAWVERTFVVGSGRPASHSVYVTMLNGEGKPTSASPFRVPYGSTQPDLKNLTIAMNRNTILVLVTTVGPDPSGSGPRHELWAATVTRSFQASTLPQPVANPRDNFGPHATANGTSELFLVACDDGGTRKVITIGRGGMPELTSPVSLDLDASTHSPFLSPTENSSTNFTLHYVRIKENSGVTTSEFSTLVYTAGSGSILAGSRSHSERIERMRMAARPGERKPSLSLWVSREAVSGKRFLSIAAISPSGLVELVRPRSVGPAPHFGEELVLMPDSSRYVFYHHTPSPAPPAGVSQLYVQPFCGL